MQALKQHGIEKLVPLGHSFDPNLHTALFELPDPSKEAGTIGAVTKVGSRSTMSVRAIVMGSWELSYSTPFQLTHVRRFLQNGYLLNGRLIRPAEVGVVRSPPDQS
jgi:molecular chaperone GrpE (heat shock protein)